MQNINNVIEEIIARNELKSKLKVEKENLKQKYFETIELHDLILNLVNDLSLRLKVPNNDSGPFDSSFCSNLEHQICSSLNDYITQKTRENYNA